MSVQWTEDQEKVIAARDKNLLVSAAAGSGKTAVLVERILSLITDEERRIDLDRLLITTFTKAAAGEMRERIGRALAERLKAEPENEWLQRQEALVHRAQITTIHGFCLYVIRNYFHTIGLNPNFRTADEGELKLLRQDTAEEIVEEALASQDVAFRRFADCYAGGSRGSGLEDAILQLYEYAVASPQPERWLRECGRMYRLPEDAIWSDFAGSEGILQELKNAAEDCLRQIESALELIRLPGGPLAYAEALQSDREIVRALAACDRLEKFEELLREITWKKLPSSRAKVMAGADEELCERIKTLRSEVKETVKGLGKQYFRLPSQVAFAQLRDTAEYAKTYAELTLRFLKRFEEKKRKKNILDFSDQEHLALRILTREEDGRLVPSETADVFADYFQEILVDEYQDSNLVQEAILESISGARRGRNDRFMVGDVKQSIYRFRQAEPGLFLEKYDRYGKGDGGVRIGLRQNFRSRSQVLDAVNEIFSRIMRRSLGGIDYDEAAALQPGAVYPACGEMDAELLLLSQEEWEALRKECHWTKQEAEAHLAAVRIRELLRNGQVTEGGALRPARPGDIVILLRTMSGWSETFVRVLQDEGIPASAQSREGYFETMEVETLLSYLQVLDNPTQEIPLAAAMHGMLGGFSSEELALVRAEYPSEGYARACAHYLEEGPDGALREKLKKFFGQTDDYRARAAYTSIRELLWQIVTETGYLDEVAALPGGEQRLANVEMLLKKAGDYEKISYHGLFHFVRYIEKMQKYQMDYGEADVSGGEAVRIMSVHHSKGLEFPIVIAAGLGKSFNRQESREKMVFGSRYGVGMDYVDPERRMKSPTILKQLIRRTNLLDGMGEELRVLYVALTRAREKLIMTGMAKEKLLKQEGAEGGEPLLYLQLSGADCALDWIVPARSRENSSIRKEQISLEAILQSAVGERTKQELGRDELEKIRLFGGTQEALSQVTERLSFTYPWERERGRKQKYSVTELKKLRIAEESDAVQELYPESDVIPLIPQFIEKTGAATGAARGTIYHTVMEWMDFAKVHTLTDVDAELAGLVEKGKLTEEECRAVRREDFLTFAGSRLAARMEDAARRGALYREQPFVIGLPAKELDGLGGEEQFLVQGIIDAFFCEDDQIVIVDYKTDRVQRSEQLAEKYHAQLEYYERALTMSTGKAVKERLIYSFALGETIEV